MQICRVCRGYLRPISGSTPALIKHQRRKTPDSKDCIIPAIFDKFLKKSDIGIGGILSSVLGQLQLLLGIFKTVHLIFPKEPSTSFVRSQISRSQAELIGAYLTQSKMRTSKTIFIDPLPNSSEFKKNHGQLRTNRRGEFCRQRMFNL